MGVLVVGDVQVAPIVKAQILAALDLLAQARDGADVGDHAAGVLVDDEQTL